ncbi:aldo/keto reductase [Gracilinema caldarium]|uniref:NADP-dependent oxidoreductase domain protein n=1 Tax=Gracilinema caldarium (strain ATCC 51460 / DSM 7334 / H1) TaxID=744872 RepID=F8F363_GRAC1|nr:aldo/keto reductase [Gracilinema caldarium]AEJ20389.1 NADP-dependent oxidoreductase domain protein [Gracilinema caldarium DSM 7334]
MKRQTQLPRRIYKGKDELSIIGFGGIVVCSVSQKEADHYVAEAMDLGINYFDVAPSYFDGEAEIKLGNALKPWRKEVFLACKTTRRDAAGARAELETSLKRAHTDHFDLYQFHALTTMGEVSKILGPSGAAETFIKAKEAGLVRYLGFSAHSVEAALTLLDQFPIDSVLFPLNMVSIKQGNFGLQILEKAKEKGAARLALKALAYTPWQEGEPHTYSKAWYKPIEDPDLQDKALRYTLSLDITAAIPPGHYELYRRAVDIASHFKPLTQEEQNTLDQAISGLTPLFPLKE